MYFDSSSVGHSRSLLVISLGICAIPSSVQVGPKPGCLNRSEKSGSHIIGRGPGQSHCIPQRHYFLLRARPIRGPKPSHLRACRFSAQTSLVGSPRAKLRARVRGFAAGASASGPPLPWQPLEQGVGRRGAGSLSPAACSPSAPKRGASVVGRS